MRMMTWVLGAAVGLAPTMFAQTAKEALSGTCTIDAGSVEKLSGNAEMASCKPNVTIPAGKRWVIETVSVACRFDSPSTPAAINRISMYPYFPSGVGAYKGMEFTVVDLTSSTGTGMNDMPRRVTRGSLRGPFYTDLPPQFEFERFAGYVQFAYCAASVTGYLADKQ